MYLSKLTKFAASAFTFACVAGFAHSDGDKKNDQLATKQDAVDEKTIAALITQLGDNSVEKRETAHKRLKEIGRPGFGLLKKAAKEGTDAEVREHTLRLIQDIQELGLEEFKVEFKHDFRGKEFPQKTFEMVGQDAEKRIKAEPDGLRINLPAEPGKTGPVGVVPRLRIQGDFDLTVGYEILRADQPKDRWGVGINCNIQATGPTEESMMISHLTSPDGRNVYKWNRLTLSMPGDRGPVPGIPFGSATPTESKGGHLRLTRVGSLVMASVAEGKSDKFQAVSRAELGTEDITPIRLVAIRSGGPNAVDIRLFSLRIRCVEKDGLKKTDYRTK